MEAELVDRVYSNGLVANMSTQSNGVAGEEVEAIGNTTTHELEIIVEAEERWGSETDAKKDEVGEAKYEEAEVNVGVGAAKYEEAEADVWDKNETEINTEVEEKAKENVDAKIQAVCETKPEKGVIDKGKKVEHSSQIEVGESSTANDEKILRHMPAKLYKAAMQGNVDIAKNFWERLGTALTPTGNSVLHVHVAAPVHVRTVSAKFLNAILRTALALLNVTNDRGETPLHLAANFGHQEAVKLFLGKDQNLLGLVNVDGDTALHMAARNKHTGVAVFLLSLTLRINYTTNAAGETPLYLAVQSGSTELVTSMLRECEKPLLGSLLTGSILHAAILWGNSDMIGKIINKYPELIEYKDIHGQTPVHYAAGIDNSMLQVLLERESFGAAYIQDNEMRTPAHIAAQQNNVNGLKLLVHHFPDSCEIADKLGRNIVHYAAFLGRIETLDYFLKDIRFSDLVNKRDGDGNTPLHLLARSLTDLPIASLRQVKLLIPKLQTLQLNTYNKQLFTPGDIANSIKIFDLETPYQDVVRDFRMVAPKGGRVKHWLQPLEKHKVDIEAQTKDLASNLLRTAKTHTVVATLIATISFTAGLSVPGGFNQDTKDNIKGGTAMLSNKVAFRVFLISDCIALVCSLTAILCYFWIAIGKGKGSAKALFFWAFQASTISIFGLMVAFMAGTYAILQPSSKAFAVSIILILSIFAYFYCIFAMGVIQISSATKSLMKGMQPQKLKREVLHGQCQVQTRSPISSFLGLLKLILRPGQFLVQKLAENFFRRLRTKA